MSSKDSPPVLVFPTQNPSTPQPKPAQKPEAKPTTAVIAVKIETCSNGRPNFDEGYTQSYNSEIPPKSIQQHYAPPRHNDVRRQQPQPPSPVKYIPPHQETNSPKANLHTQKYQQNQNSNKMPPQKIPEQFVPYKPQSDSIPKSQSDNPIVQNEIVRSPPKSHSRNFNNHKDGNKPKVGQHRSPCHNSTSVGALDLLKDPSPKSSPLKPYSPKKVGK